MPKIKFMPSGNIAEVSAGSELLEAAEKIGVVIEAPCGQKGTCGKCIVRVVKGSVDSNSLGLLSKDVVADGYILACKTKVLNEDVVIEVPETVKKGGKFVEDSGDGILIRSELMPEKKEFDPLASKILLKVPEPKKEDGLSDFDRLSRAVRDKFNNEKVIIPISIIRKVADALREDNGNVTVTVVTNHNELHIIDIVPGNNTDSNFGLAIDLGTTTVAVMLVDLISGKIIETKTDYNDQITRGVDVISRINYAKNSLRISELRGLVLNTINRLINHIINDYNIKNNNIYNSVISGNTTMIHLLLGLNPEYIRLDPYIPTIMNIPFISAEEVGIKICPESPVFISPSVGSYVGGDITAGVLCTDFVTDNKGVNLFIDIGTNGELVIGNNEFLMTCACSAGPAFEGGNIDNGMRAALGAIEKIELDPETGKSKFKTIGDVRPRGICGSGMISLLALLFTNGFLDEHGKLSRDKKSDSIIIEDRYAKYVIADSNESHDGEPIFISELDIMNIIRAKAAIFSACELMVNQIGIKFDDIENVYIAGGFGRYLDLEYAKIIGLIPDIEDSKFQYIGNSSLMGSYMILISHKYSDKQLEIAKRMTYMDLSNVSGYMDHYTAALFLPHTNIDLFPSVKKR